MNGRTLTDIEGKSEDKIFKHIMIYGMAISLVSTMVAFFVGRYILFDYLNGFNAGALAFGTFGIVLFFVGVKLGIKITEFRLSLPNQPVKSYLKF